MATVKITVQNCGHVHIDITHNGEVENHVLTKADLIAAVTERDRPFDIVIANLKTYVRTQRGLGKTWGEIRTAVEGKEFKL